MGKIKPSNVAIPTICAVNWAPLPEKIPTASSPQMPQTACTEIDPQGSSTFRCSSNHSTERTTNVPATIPVMIAVAGFSIAQPALLATSPAIHPLAISEASGRRKRTRVTTAAVRAAAAAEKVVLMITSADRSGCIPVYRIAPSPLTPSHPTQASMHPNRTNTWLCAGIAAGMPFGGYLPRRGPVSQTTESAVSPPTALMKPEPEESTNGAPSQL